MIYKLLDENNPSLRKPAERFDFANPPVDPVELFENLKETMIANHGYSLSASQVGIPYQVFVMGDFNNPDSIFSVFNPRVIEEGKDVLMEESSLTYKGFFVKIKRPANIEARFSGHDGVAGTMPFSSLGARLFLQQVDHLQGITLKQRATPLQIERALAQKKKLDKKRAKNVKD